MSVKYRLVERNNMGKDKEETPKKLYAQPVYSDLVGFEELLGEITKRRSTPFLHYSNLKSDRLFNFRSVAATVATAVIFGNNLFLSLEIGILTSFTQGRSRTENDSWDFYHIGLKFLFFSSSGRTNPVTEVSEFTELYPSSGCQMFFDQVVHTVHNPFYLVGRNTGFTDLTQ